MVKVTQSKIHKTHLTLPENRQGRDFVVADLHGHRALLDSILEEVKFNPHSDRVISVGDLADRGPDSLGCLELLEEPWFWAVRGNHEQMLIDAVTLQTEELWSRWLLNGGSWVFGYPETQLTEWAAVLKFLPYTITVPVNGHCIGICHAEYLLETWQERLEDDTDDSLLMSLLWGRSRLRRNDRRVVKGIDWVFCGHTIIGGTRVLGNSVFMDLGAYSGGPLNLIEIGRWLAGRNPSET